MPRVTVVGLGYMGLPTALLIARTRRFEVVGQDIADERVALLARGELPFAEPGLPELYAAARGAFRATTALEPSEAFILALPTPADAQHRCDDSALEAAITGLARVVRDRDVVIVESTVAPGTTLRLREQLRAASGRDVGFAYVSEKAIPGKTLHEMVHNDRVVGIADEGARALTREIYASFVEGELAFTDATTAEAVKLCENTFRDVNIALANELAELSEEHGIDVYEAIALANRHPRVNILSPGPGVGGHCIAVDPWFLVQGTRAGALVRASRQINDARPAQVAERIAARVPVGAKIALLGVAYKADVDDARESPSHAIEAALLGRGYRVALHDPFVRAVGVSSELGPVLEGAACVVLATDHSVYKALDIAALALPGALIVDTRGVWRRRGLPAERYLLLGAGSGGRA